MIKRVRKDLGALLVLILFISTLSATILQFVKGNLFQQALAGNGSELSRSIVLVVALVAIELLFYFLEWKVENKIYSGFLREAKGKIADRFIQKSKFDDLDESKAETINLLANKIDRLEYQYFYSLFSNVYLFFRIVLVTFSLIYINLFIGLVLFAFLFVPLLVTKFFKNRLSSLEQKYQALKGENLEKYENFFSNLKTMKTLDLREIMSRRLNKSIDSEVSQYQTSRDTGNLANVINSTLSYTSHVFVLIASVVLVFQGHLQAGMVITLLGLVEQLSMPILVFSRNLNNINSTQSIREEILQNLDKAPEQEVLYKNPALISTENLKVRFDQNEISYPNLNFRLDKNYLIEGKSGIGKSLFIDLLLKNRSSYEGSVRIDGKDSAPFGKISNIGYIETSNQLFKESVQFNLLFGEKMTAENRKLAKQLLSEQILDSETIVNLSSGEKRRVLLLRGLLSSKKMIIFDEPTANLDKETADIFWKLLTQIKTKHFIVISHLTPEAFVEFFDEKIDFSELVVKKDRQYD